MPITATAQKVDLDTDTNRWIASAEVIEADGSTVVYYGAVDNNDAWRALTAPQKRAALAASVKAARDRVIGPASRPAWAGTVTL